MGKVLWYRVVISMAIHPIACGYPPLPGLANSNDASSSDGSNSDGPNSDATNSDATSLDSSQPLSFRSCLNLPATCGPDANDNCCNSPLITHGTYNRSHDLANDGSSGNSNSPATVSDFRLDKYEVTVGRFRAFVNAGMGIQSSPPMAGAGAHATIPGSGWDVSWNNSLAANTADLVSRLSCSMFPTWTDTPAGNDRRPINCITWYEAFAFCAWDNGYLPTEAEWNYAAAGGDEQRAYPWSSPPNLLAIDSLHASYDCIGDGTGCTIGDMMTGAKPAGDGRWGQSDLGGDVWEWALDWWGDYMNPCSDCARLVAPFPTSFRVIRGGSWLNSRDTLRTGYRDSLGSPESRSHSQGIRCARSP